MNTHAHTAHRLGASLAIGSAALAVPSVALAEGAADASILLPKPSEFIPALIAFLIIWAILAKLVWPKVIANLDARQKKIADDLDAAEQSRRKAEARHQADDIVAEAKRSAEEERSQILAKAQDDASSVVSKAHDAVNTERRKAMIELSSSVVDLSVEIASKIIGNSLSEDQQRELAAKYLAEVGTPNDNA
jgi:F-type H+-transporting ATPase subunit b